MNTDPVVVLVSGFLTDARYWRSQIEALRPYADIIVPDLKNLDSLEAMALKILDSAPDSFSVAGHSMGGRVAFELMRLAPQRIDKFAVMDTAVHPLQEGEVEQREELVQFTRTNGISALAEQWSKTILSPAWHTNAEIMQLVQDMVKGYTPRQFEQQISALLNRADQSRYLADIRNHVLLICGKEDTWSPVAQHQAMAAQLSSSELVLVEGCGHMITLEAPEKLNTILIDWLTSGKS